MNEMTNLGGVHHANLQEKLDVINEMLSIVEKRLDMVTAIADAGAKSALINRLENIINRIVL